MMITHPRSAWDKPFRGVKDVCCWHHDRLWVSYVADCAPYVVTKYQPRHIFPIYSLCVSAVLGSSMLWIALTHMIDVVSIVGVVVVVVVAVGHVISWCRYFCQPSPKCLSNATIQRSGHLRLSQNHPKTREFHDVPIYLTNSTFSSVFLKKFLWLYRSRSIADSIT